MSSIRVTGDSFDRKMQRLFADMKKWDQERDKEIEAAGGEENYMKLIANKEYEIPEPDPIRDRTIVSAAL